MARYLVAILLIIACIPLFLVAHTSGIKPDGQSGPVLGKPLSAIEERHSEQIMNDGSRVDHPSSGLFYRDEQGRMRVESQTKFVIYDPVAGFIYSADVRTKTYRKFSVQSGLSVSVVVVEDGTWIASSAAVPGAKPGAPAGNEAAANSESEGGNTKAVSEDLPSAVVNGIRARGSRLTTTIPAGTVGNDRDLKAINERWYSDDVKVLLRSSSSDPRFGSVKYELTNISQTPPEASLFQLPQGFTQIGDKK